MRKLEPIRRGFKDMQRNILLMSTNVTEEQHKALYEASESVKKFEKQITDDLKEAFNV